MVKCRIQAMITHGLFLQCTRRRVWAIKNNNEEIFSLPFSISLLNGRSLVFPGCGENGRKYIEITYSNKKL